jgi:hypothetical protein
MSPVQSPNPAFQNPEHSASKSAVILGEKYDYIIYSEKIEKK